MTTPREATPFGQRPWYLIRDNDGKYGAQFARMAEASGITILRAPYRVPQANGVCERFLGSVRRECLDHVPILTEAHRRRVLKDYVRYFNRARPRQGLGQSAPQPVPATPLPCRRDSVVAIPVLGGRHHDYRRAA